MNILDDIESQKKLDKEGVYESIESLPLQISQAWREVKNIPLLSTLSGAKNVIVSGMGGSALGGRIVDSLILDRVRVPIEVSTEFRLPHYANENTLVILSSYSGNTEETIETGLDAINKKCRIFGITTGGKLSEFILKNNIPGYIFKPLNNPSNQPRMSLGYSIASILGILSGSEYINITNDEILAVANNLNNLAAEYGRSVDHKNNIAKVIANKLFRKVPILITSEHLIGSAHAFKNQLNENAKTFITLFDLPEANHHLLEGLKFPATNSQVLHFLFIESDLFSVQVKKRFPITEEVVSKNQVGYDVYKCSRETKLDQVFEVLLFGSFVGYYLAMLNGINPSPIPWVDYFKAQLK